MRLELWGGLGVAQLPEGSFNGREVAVAVRAFSIWSLAEVWWNLDLPKGRRAGSAAGFWAKVCLNDPIGPDCETPPVS